MSFAQSTATIAAPRARLTRRLAILVALTFAAAAAAALAHPTEAFAWGDNAFSSGAERDLVALTNRSRASAGRKSLRISATLSSIARWRSKDMIKRDYFSHSIPGYGNVFKRISSSGFCYHVAGENIGWTTGSDSAATSKIHGMFMDSSGHRANILGKSWDVIGVGAYKGADGKKMYTVLFADKCGSTKSSSKPGSKPKPRPASKPAASRPKATIKAKAKPSFVIGAAPAAPTSPPRVEPSDAPDLAVPAPAARPTPSALAAEPSPADAADLGRHGLRVVDAAAPPGLLDSIIGGVTGFFFGG
jgi:uncharacterized protein YkwD